MLTPQDIREKTFEKAMFGGYDMAAIDEYLEAIAADMALLQKENAVLKGKMKVLVEKIEEYRRNEEALNQAVVSAQRLGGMIESEARAKAEGIVAEAQNKADEITAASVLQIQLEEARLAEAKRVSAKFIAGMNAICTKQMAFLDKIGQADFVRNLSAETAAPAAAPAPVAEPAPAPAANEVHETVKSIEETVSKVADVPEQTIVPDIPAPAPAFDSAPTRAFGTVDAGEAQFSFDSFDDVD